MKKIMMVLLLILPGGSLLKAQTPYTSLKDERQVTILNGIISKYILQNDSAFNWYASSRNSYVPDSTIINTMEASKNKIQFIIFGGTWCEDTQFILPKFFRLQEKSGIPDSSISFFAVNRQKKTLGNFADAFKITNVPTIIVMKDGKEAGRIVEYGKTGKWDQELADIIKQTP